MNDSNIVELIAEAREYADAISGGENENWMRLVGVVEKLADALEAVTVSTENRAALLELSKRPPAVSVADIEAVTEAGLSLDVTRGIERRLLIEILDDDLKYDIGESCPVFQTEMAADAILAAGFRLPVPVEPESAEQLDALPEGTVILDSFGDALQYRDGLWCGYESKSFGSEWVWRKFAPLTVVRLPAPVKPDATEYALLQAESVIEQALKFADDRAFDVLRSYGITAAPLEPEWEYAIGHYRNERARGKPESELQVSYRDIFYTHEEAKKVHRLLSTHGADTAGFRRAVIGKRRRTEPWLPVEPEHTPTPGQGYAEEGR